MVGMVYRFDLFGTENVEAGGVLGEGHVEDRVDMADGADRAGTETGLDFLAEAERFDAVC